MEMTQEWQSSKSKKNSRRLSLSLLGKPRQFHPKRHSLDLQQIQGYKPTKKNSVELQRKTSRRKSTDQQIKSWLSPKKHTTEKQNAYTQTSEQFLHQEADQQQAKEEEVPVQRSKDKQAKDQKSVEELYPEGHINGKEEEDQESDKEQRPEEQAQIQPAEDQQMQEQKAPESQFPNSQERQQMLLKRAPTQPWVTSSEYRTTELTATAYDSQNRVQKVLIRKLKILGIKLSQVMNLLSALGAAAGIILLIFGFLLDGEFLCGYSPDGDFDYADDLQHC
ncbi:hypothetical protein NN561_004263 [Cricetulus griseus]